jgi:hypothetical protein
MANMTTAIQGGTAAPTPGDSQTTKGVFISPDSLTFPGAAAVCSALLGGANLFIVGAGKDVRWALVICFLIGSFIIYAGWPGGTSKREKGIFLGVGAINIGLLFVSVIGVASAATNVIPGVPGG